MAISPSTLKLFFNDSSPSNLMAARVSTTQDSVSSFSKMPATPLLIAARSSSEMRDIDSTPGCRATIENIHFASRILSPSVDLETRQRDRSSV